MAQQNLLVDWLNKNNNRRANWLANIQASMANKTTATNPTTVQTPNTPITPTISRPQTNLNLKMAQQPVQTRLDNLNNQTLPQSTITTNNPAFQNGILKASPTNEVANTAQNRFIWFQTPQTNQNTTIWTWQEAKSFNKLMNGEYMLIESNEEKAKKLNKKEQERYQKLSDAIIDLQGDLLKNNGTLTDWQLTNRYPEFSDNLDALKELQEELRPIVQGWMWVDPDQISQLYPELISAKKVYDLEKVKSATKEREKEYNNIKNIMDQALTLNVEWLSSNWLKVASDYNTLFNIVETVKKKYSLWDANNSEVFAYLVKNNQKVKELYDEIKTAEGNLTENDKAILNRKDANTLLKYINGTSTGLIDLAGKWLEKLGLWGNTKATDEEIQTAINAKQKLESDFANQTWKKLAVEINVPLDSMEKFVYRTYKDIQNKILEKWSDYTKKTITKTIKSAFKDAFGKELTDEQVESIKNLYDTAVTPSVNQEIQTNQQNVMDYLESVNKDYQNKKGTLDEDIENYTNNMSMTKALLNRDWKWFGYKSTWEAAQNAEMPLMVLAGTVAPEVVLPLMTMDSYARESQESFEELMEVQEKMWIPKEQAYQNAQEGSAIVWIASAAVEVGLEKVLWWVETTASKAFHELIMKDVAEKTTKMVAERGLVDLLKKWMVTQFRSSFEEWMEEILQQWIHNKAIQKYDPDHKLTEWLLESFEWGFFNWMNLLGWGWDILNSIKQNSNAVNQAAYNLWQGTRNVVDNLNQWAYNAGERTRKILDNVRNKVTTQNTQENTAITPVEQEAIELKDDTTEKNTAIKEWWVWEKVLEQLNWLDENTRERIKKNPYSVEESKNLIKEMDENPWIDFGDYQNGRYEEVLDQILNKLEQKENKRKNDIGSLYDKLEQANTEVDVSELKSRVSEFQAQAEALEDIITTAEQAQIKTILKNIEQIWDWTMDVWKARRIADRWTKGSINSTYDWIWLIRDIRDSIDEVIREQNPDMKEVDKSYHQILKEIWEIKGNLVYQKWGVKNNAVSTVKNLLNASNYLYLEKLEKYLPWIKDQLEAIRDSKFVYNAYTTWKGSRFISGIARWVFGNLWKALWFVWFGWAWLLGWAIVDAAVDKAMVNLTRNALKKTITQETEKSKAELERINKKIEEWKKLDAEDKARLKELGENIVRNWEQMAKTKAEKEAWNRFIEEMDENITPQTTAEEQEKNKVTKKAPKKKNKVTENKPVAVKKPTNKEEAIAWYKDEIMRWMENVVPKDVIESIPELQEASEARKRGLAKPDGVLLYTNSEFKYIPSVKEGLIRLTKEEWNAKFEEQMKSALENWFTFTILSDIDTWETYVYNPYMTEEDEYRDNKDMDNIWQQEFDKDNVDSFEIKDGDIWLNWKDEWTGKTRTEQIDLKDFLNTTYLSKYVSKNNTENTGTKTSKNKITNTKQAKVDTFEEIDPETLKILIDNGDKAAIKLYEEMGIEDDALEQLYLDMERERLWDNAPSIFEDEVIYQNNQSDNETPQIPTIFEEDLQERNIRNLEENETAQTTDEEAPKNKVTAQKVEEKPKNLVTSESKVDRIIRESEWIDELEYSEEWDAYDEKYVSFKDADGKEHKYQVTNSELKELADKWKITPVDEYTERQAQRDEARNQVDKEFGMESDRDNKINDIFNTAKEQLKKAKTVSMGAIGKVQQTEVKLDNWTVVTYIKSKIKWDNTDSAIIRVYSPTQWNKSYVVTKEWDNIELIEWGRILTDEEINKAYDILQWKTGEVKVEDMKVDAEDVEDKKDPINAFLDNNETTKNDPKMKYKYLSRLNDNTSWTDYKTDIKYNWTVADKIQQTVDSFSKLFADLKVPLRFSKNNYWNYIEAWSPDRWMQSVNIGDDIEFEYAKFLYDNPDIRSTKEFKAEWLKEAIKKGNEIHKEVVKDAEELKEWLPLDPEKYIWQQPTAEQWIDAVYEQVKRISDFYEAAAKQGSVPSTEQLKEISQKRWDAGDAIWKKLQFKSDRSKLYNDFITNIKEANWNEKQLRSIAKNLYIKKVKDDFKSSYNYPSEVTDKVPWLRTAKDDYERYLKGRDTSFSGKDPRIDYSDKDRIWAWIKRQDWNQITAAQRREIVNGVLEYAKVMWVDMKKMSEDAGVTYVHLNWKHPFLTSRAVWLFHWLFKSISVGADMESYREKEKWKGRDGKMETHTVPVVMAHEITHAIDSMFEWNLFADTKTREMARNMNEWRRLWPYWHSKEEVTARMVEEYVNVMEWWEWYYDLPWYWSKEVFDNQIKPYVEQIFQEKFDGYRLTDKERDAIKLDEAPTTKNSVTASDLNKVTNR